MRSYARKSQRRGKRTRSGCLTCRKRRRKCDEGKPVCEACKVRDAYCQWGINVSFHSSRAFELDDEDRCALEAVEAQREAAKNQGRTPLVDPERPRGSIIDCTSTIYDLLQDRQNERRHRDGEENILEDGIPTETSTSSDPDISARHSHFEDATSDVTELGRDDVASVVQWPTEPTQEHDLRTGVDLPESTQLAALNEEIPLDLFDLDIAPFCLGQSVSRHNSPEPEPDFRLSDRERVDLIHLYLRDTATWCETTDSEMNFSVKSPHILLRSSAFTAAVMTLASRQRDLLQGKQRQLTLELYQYTIRLLLRHEPSNADAAILATCTALCAYEMMGSSVEEWRRHLRGCAGLLRMRKWDGSGQGIVKTCFWAFARIDVWAAFLTGQRTLIPTYSWVEDDSVDHAAIREDVDDYCNLVILIFARIINLLNGGIAPHTLSTRDFREAVCSLWSDLQRWRQSRFYTLTPLLECERSQASPFPARVYTSSSAICGNTFYHSGCILLLETGYIDNASEFLESDIRDPIWHAREIGGISVSNISHANWVNHLQPLYLAGRTFADGLDSYKAEPTIMNTEEKYTAEKAALLRHLARIERATGWKTSARAQDLRVLWGWELAGHAMSA